MTRQPNPNMDSTLDVWPWRWSTAVADLRMVSDSQWGAGLPVQHNQAVHVGDRREAKTRPAGPGRQRILRSHPNRKSRAVPIILTLLSLPRALSVPGFYSASILVSKPVTVNRSPHTKPTPLLFRVDISTRQPAARSRLRQSGATQRSSR